MNGQNLPLNIFFFIINGNPEFSDSLKIFNQFLVCRMNLISLQIGHGRELCDKNNIIIRR